MRVGGCNASRGAFIGACFGAMYGEDIVPQAWKDKTLKYSSWFKLGSLVAEWKPE